MANNIQWDQLPKEHVGMLAKGQAPPGFSGEVTPAVIDQALLYANRNGIDTTTSGGQDGQFGGTLKSTGTTEFVTSEATTAGYGTG